MRCESLHIIPSHGPIRRPPAGRNTVFAYHTMAKDGPPRGNPPRLSANAPRTHSLARNQLSLLLRRYLRKRSNHLHL